VRYQPSFDRFKTKTARLGLIVSATVVSVTSVLGFAPAFANGNGMTTVYDNIPSPTPSNVPSVGFEATSTSEFGGQLKLAGNARSNPTVKVLMSSWACKSGTWFGDNCITNPGSNFTHPVTLNVYEVNTDQSPGALITSETKNFTMPYRPTADDGTNCNAANNKVGEWWDGTSCVNGKAFTISFDLDKDITLPDNVVLSVAYNTSDYGQNKLGDATPCHATAQGCPYDSLNVGTAPGPTVGMAKPTADDAYLNSMWSGAYCDTTTTNTGNFRLDTGCWTGYQPAFEVSAKKTNDHPSHGHGHAWGNPGNKDNHGHSDRDFFSKHND
jgi:hypothetical protein